MTLPHTPEEQREAARAVMKASIETLLDLEIPAGIIVEVLASTAISLGKTTAVRNAKKRSTNDDQPDDGSGDQR
jgi:hypothetical protein